jgi:hypothetical protein
MEGFTIEGSERTDGIDQKIGSLIGKEPNTHEEKLQQVTALRELIKDPLVTEKMRRADLVAERLGNLERDLFGTLVTPHETAGIPAQ